MDVSVVLQTVDNMFNEGRADEVEGLLHGAIGVALEEQDGVSLLQLLNELIGYYRETSRYEEAYKVAGEIEMVAGQILPEISIPYATSMLNIATAFRAGGRSEDALEKYEQVEAIYDQLLDSNDLLRASLYNNESLLFQEMGQFDKAKEKLTKALEIVTSRGDVYEEAVSRANIAASCMQLGELEEGYEHATKAIEIFSEIGVNDGHFAAALSALGSYHYIKGEFEEGAVSFKRAMEIMESYLGKNDFYYRLKENYETCKKATDNTSAKNDKISGLELCRKFYEECGKKLLEEHFGDYLNCLAVGLIGEGSDCYGYDDEISRDHDWGPDFCIFIDDEVYEKIGDKFVGLYETLPEEFVGYKRSKSNISNGRRGVIKISEFCERILGIKYQKGVGIREQIDWKNVPDASLSAFTNGQIWYDPSRIITSLREEVLKGYPENIVYAKLAQSCSLFSQCGQYNLLRCVNRGDFVTAELMKAEAVKEALKLAYYIENKFPPHDKWLLKGLDALEGGEVIKTAVKALYDNETYRLSEGGAKFAQEVFEKIGSAIVMQMYAMDYVSDIDPYIGHHSEELLRKMLGSLCTNEELAMQIAGLEFEAFDKVKNEGGRASCQNDWNTFSIMRRSQYLTWNRNMLLQYLYDFEREFRLGHNLITEKYGRMMESTAPEKYEEIKTHFSPLSEEQKAIIEELCKIQVAWMEEFSDVYPHLAGQARSIHTYDDNPFNTSYETYLRGELGTYSDKMLQLYTKFIVGFLEEGKNLAKLTMENSCKLYGYKSLEDAEKFMSL